MQARDKVMEEVKKYFKPELVNWLDKIIVFDPLSHEQLRKVARLHMKKIASSLAERGITFTLTEAVIDYSVNESYDPVYGVRPIKRWLDEKVETELAMMLLKEEIVENSIVYIDVGPAGSELIYRMEKNGGSVNASEA